ncbi:hypothetical protein [Prescottella agglutinans]|uniref:Uncharacterized protein n=1 Tax=Prescottella agglutinans TaxID=1644129 RepID=A0ABT6MFZ5_9NOCA|nr:hypothetical protein [Prescottella agglutinans]MDH6283243.1 hypothetical protein [Prescottella agglutinans]
MRLIVPAPTPRTLTLSWRGPQILTLPADLLPEVWAPGADAIFPSELLFPSDDLYPGA